MGPMSPDHHGTVLCDLPDSCLLQVFKHLSPLPDKFNIGACCWRFHRLVSDRRLWLVVSPSKLTPGAADLGGAGPTYPNLKAAVEASRPGDTIWLAPGVVHEAADCIIRWPLHLLGGGRTPCDTWLTAPQAADCALAFAASAKVAMLAISTTLCPCIVHKRGSLTVQRCLLRAEAKGLDHLVAPVLTLAVGSSSSSSGSNGSSSASLESSVQLDASTAAVAAVAASTKAAAAVPAAVPGSSGSSVMCRQLLLSCIGSGKLQVVESQLMGGSTAVKCGGTGQVRNVRAIYELHSQAPYFWLEVDSTDVEASGTTAAAAGGSEQSYWEAAGVFLQHREQVAAAAAAAAANGDAADVLLLEQRSKAWQQRQQQLSLPTPAAAGGAGAAGGGGAEAGGALGVARIQAVLGGRSINPAALAAHLTARQQQQKHQ